MSKTLRKKRHWLSKVQECVVSWGGPAGPDPDLLRGGAERGEFPYLAGRLPPGGEGAPGPALLSGKAPAPGDVLLEVNGTPVSGLTHRDTLAVVRHFREPVRLKTVRPGEPAVVSTGGRVGAWLARMLLLCPVGFLICQRPTPRPSSGCSFYIDLD
uniref:PDZ domain-containing protein n=1 Tax=Accipiter nisus TaxID=211598 RepID=A0A8B9MG91_9AVES